MYKKYIKKRGRLTGPYYYESVRLKTGKIKTIYLGKTPDKEKLAKKLMRFKVEVDEIITKGNTIVVPISRENIIVKDALALSEIFKDAMILESVSKFKLLSFRLPKINFLNYLNSIKESQKKLSDYLQEYIPKPGKNDFDFEVLLFLMMAGLFVFGFFYLETSVTTLAVFDIKSTNHLPVIMGVLNLLLLVRIYFDLRDVKK